MDCLSTTNKTTDKKKKKEVPGVCVERDETDVERPRKEKSKLREQRQYTAWLVEGEW